MNTLLKVFFPALSEASLAEFNTVYALENFDNSSHQALVATGESELKCAVRLQTHDPALRYRLIDA